MTDRHFAFWPKRVPHSLTLPETNVYYTPYCASYIGWCGSLDIHDA